MSASPLLIIFLKVPKPGLVKTRLAASVGADRACEIYRRLVEKLLVNLDSIDEIELRIAPDDGVSVCGDWVKKGWGLRPQGDGDLGARMSRAFEEAFQRGYDRVVAIGSDCPYVQVPHIKEAFSVLKQDDMVIGPATDGGYWLIGMRAFYPELFHGIDWSTEAVLGQTLGLAKESGLSMNLMEILEDIDDEEAWKRYESGN